MQGELERARTGLTRALALARGAGDIDSIGHAELVFGHVEHAVGNLDAARDNCDYFDPVLAAATSSWPRGETPFAFLTPAPVLPRILPRSTHPGIFEGAWKLGEV